MRLWAAAKSKALCIDWCMDMYFKVVHNDINQCLEQIKVLRTPDLVPPDPFEVEIQVNVALRAKLISEVKVNICKLKVSSLLNYFLKFSIETDKNLCSSHQANVSKFWLLYAKCSVWPRLVSVFQSNNFGRAMKSKRMQTNMSISL